MGRKFDSSKGPVRTFSAILFYMLADYRNVSFGRKHDPQEEAGHWAEAIANDIRSRGWSLERASEVFKIPITVNTWEEFTVMLSMAMLYAINLSETEFGDHAGGYR